MCLRQTHQLMIGGMVFDLVHAAAEAIECSQLRRKAICSQREFGRVFASQQLAESSELRGSPTRTFPPKGLFQDRISLEPVEFRKRRRLVGYLMGVKFGNGLAGRHADL